MNAEQGVKDAVAHIHALRRVAVAAAGGEPVDEVLREVLRESASWLMAWDEDDQDELRWGRDQLSNDPGGS